jgi:hypothetical protein
VRPLLLVLLWIWALCVFLVVDLFLNIEEFDAIRPRASLYRGMRYAAHRMVGEPCLERDFGRPAVRRSPYDARADTATLRAALHPTAPLRGGVAAVRRAARSGDEATWDLFLELLAQRDLVNGKLPLTERRDDLDLLDAAIAPVARHGTAAQRDRLAALITGALDTETDTEARRRFRMYGTALLRAGDLPGARRVLLEHALKRESGG